MVDLSRWMQWLMPAHVRRYHEHKLKQLNLKPTFSPWKTETKLKTMFILLRQTQTTNDFTQFEFIGSNILQRGELVLGPLIEKVLSQIEKVSSKLPKGYQILCGLLLMAIGLSNFLIYFSWWPEVGGTAWHGKVEDGQFFLGYRETFTEVSKTLWVYSDIHGKSVFLTNIGGMLGLLIFFFAVRRYQEEDEQKFAVNRGQSK